MKHLVLFENYNRRVNIESIIYSVDNQEAGFVSGVVYNEAPAINSWLHVNGFSHSYEQISQYGLPIAFLDRIEVEEDYRNSGLGNNGLDDFIDQASQYDVAAIVLVSDMGNKQVEGFNLNNWYISKGFEIVEEHEYGALIILKLDTYSDYNSYDEDSEDDMDY